DVHERGERRVEQQCLEAVEPHERVERVDDEHAVTAEEPARDERAARLDHPDEVTVPEYQAELVLLDVDLEVHGIGYLRCGVPRSPRRGRLRHAPSRSPERSGDPDGGTVEAPRTRRATGARSG